MTLRVTLHCVKLHCVITLHYNPFHFFPIPFPFHYITRTCVYTIYIYIYTLLVCISDDIGSYTCLTKSIFVATNTIRPCSILCDGCETAQLLLHIISYHIIPSWNSTGKGKPGKHRIGSWSRAIENNLFFQVWWWWLLLLLLLLLRMDRST